MSECESCGHRMQHHAQKGGCLWCDCKPENGTPLMSDRERLAKDRLSRNPETVRLLEKAEAEIDKAAMVFLEEDN